MANNNRRFARSEVSLPVTLTFQEAKVVQAVIRNLSIVGMFVATEDPMPAGSSCIAQFEIEPLKTVSTRCQVIRVEGNGMGMGITGIENRSFEYLREFIVNSSEDPYTADNDILENMGSLPVLF